MQPSITDLLVESATLMVVGMSFVYLFLALLIGAIKLIALINEQFPEELATNKSNKGNPIVKSSVSNDGAVLAAITAAVHQYRNKQ